MGCVFDTIVRYCYCLLDIMLLCFLNKLKTINKLEKQKKKCSNHITMLVEEMLMNQEMTFLIQSHDFTD